MIEFIYGDNKKKELQNLEFWTTNKLTFGVMSAYIINGKKYTKTSKEFYDAVGKEIMWARLKSNARI